MKEFHPNSEKAYRLLHDGILALGRAEQQGMRIDLDYSEKKEKHLTRKIAYLEAKFKKTKFYRHWQHTVSGTPNINSNYQLSVILYKVKKITPAKFTESGQGSTDEDALTQLNIPELNDLLQIRKLKKIRDTYLNAFIKEQINGFIHPFFNLHTVRTFRSSSDSPNFQNIPKRDKEAMKICRKAIYPRKGHQLMEIDYGALEVRIAACYHKDPTMLQYIKDPTTDMHGDMAKEIFLIDAFDKRIPEHKILRAAAKNGFVFPQFYGDYYKNCAVNIATGWGKLPEGKWKKGQGILMPEGTLSDHMISKGISSLDAFIDRMKKIEYHFWQERFPVYRDWKLSWFKKYQRKGYIDMYTGFRCSGLMSFNDAVNYPIQGSAFHCLLWSFIRLDEIMRTEKWKTRLLGQIHDAILLDVHPDELELVARIVQDVTCVELPARWDWINVPLEIEADVGAVDASWADLEPYKLP